MKTAMVWEWEICGNGNRFGFHMKETLDVRRIQKSLNLERHILYTRKKIRNLKIKGENLMETPKTSRFFLGNENER